MKEPIGKITKKPYFPLTGGSVLDNGGRMNSARQSIHGAPDSMMEDARTALGIQFVGLRTRWWRMHE